MINNQDIKKLKYYSIEFALMMEDHEIEQMISDFIEVKEIRSTFKKRY